MRHSVWRRLRFALSAGIVGVLVLIAVSLSLLRVVIAYAPSLRAEVEQLLAEALHRPLTLGGLRAQWVGRHPTLVLEQVRLGPGAAEGLRVDELEVGVDLLGSLRDLELRPAEISVTGLEVALEREAGGQWRLAAVGGVPIPPAEAGTTDWDLPARLRLRDGVLVLRDGVTGDGHRLPNVELTLDRDGDGYSLAGYLELPAELGRSLRFRGEWQHLPRRLGDLSGRFYLNGRGLQLQALTRLLPEGAALPALSGSVELELWSELSDGRVRELAGQVLAEQFGLADGERLADRLGGRFRWQGGGEHWFLAVNDLEFSSPYRVWPRSDLHASGRLEDGRASLELRAEYLRLEDLEVMARALPALDPGLKRALAELKPRGELLSPRFSAGWDETGLRDYGLTTEFKRLAVASRGQVPGFSGLSGELRADHLGGQVELIAGAGSLDYGRLFRAPLPFQSLRGRLGWRTGPNGWQLEAPMLRVVTEDLQAVARLRVFDQPGRESPFLDLRAHVEDGDGLAVPRYLPAGILEPHLLRWLDGAVRAGHLPQGDILFFGQAQDFPFRQADGVFEVQGDVEGGRLHYQDGWPEIEAIKGRLRFYGESMEITAEQGSILGAQVRRARVGIARLSRADLEIDGEVEGSGEQLLGFLRESPLGRGMREELAAMRLGGQHRVELRATIPIRDADATTVNGRLHLNGGDFALPAWDFALDNLKGELGFDERGVRSEGVRGMYRKRPLWIAAETRQQDGGERIRLSTVLQARPAELLGFPLPEEVSGETRWHISALLPGFRSRGAPPPPFQLRIESQLEGVALNLPEPVGKLAAEQRPLRLEARLGKQGLAPLRVDYGGHFKTLLDVDVDARRLRRVAVRFGGEAPTLPKAEGLVLAGRLAELDLDRWRRLSPAQGGGAKPTAGPAMPALREADLRIDKLHVLGQSFNETGLRLFREGQAWRAVLSGPDLEGRVLLPDDPGVEIDARLARLRLSGGGDAPAADAGPVVADAADQSLALALDVEELYLRSSLLGTLTARVGPTPGGLRLREFSLRGPLFSAEASGGWDRLRDRSELAVKFNVVNAGRTLDALGYREVIRGGLAEGVANLNWPGPPSAFSTAQVSGQLDLNATNGQILKVEPGAGRLFGLLSIADLPRRLSLDFSDLFGEGFAFDRIEAHLKMESGDAYTRLFYMQGPAARVDLDGRIGLASRDYDQRVTVTPQVSSALPAVGALTAGPMGAVVLFITDKLLGKQINKLTRFRYRVTGSWEEPRVQPLAEPAVEAPPGDPLLQEITGT